MCGIAGEAGTLNYTLKPNTLIKMCEALIHRGPDESAYYGERKSEYGIGLGSRRLAILDLDHGKQLQKDWPIKVVFNGEIYNHHAIRDELLKLGYSFQTRCDTEVLAKAIEQWGHLAINKLEGMFAFAAWNPLIQELIIARDRMGKKPLFYYWEPDINLLVFASEIKALLKHPAYTKAVNLQGLYDYLLMQYVPEPNTAFRDIYALEPGQYLSYQPNTSAFRIHTYWKLLAPVIPIEEPVTSLVADHVRNAVFSRLESDVPLGIYLSGGIDSSLITALACEQLGSKNVFTFTMGFENKAYDETFYASMIAERYKTHHHVNVVGETDISEMADRILSVYDQPFGDCSAIPTLMLAEESKKAGITVALSGDGGDEAFGGYERYRVAKLEQGIYSYFPWLHVWQYEQAKRLVKEDVLRKRKVRFDHVNRWLADKAYRFQGRDELNHMSFIDCMTYLVGDIIVKMERATMSQSIEARCPFLDHQVMELAFMIPSHKKQCGSQMKAILREAFNPLIPDAIWTRRKQGFGVPIGEWFRTSEGIEFLNKTLLGKEQWFYNEPIVFEHVSEHLQRRTNRGHQLWVLAMAYLWLQKHFG